MAKLDSLDSVGIFVRDLRKARDFYTKKLGLKVREWTPKWRYLTLGATKTGLDASLGLWQPEPSWGAEMYEDGMKAIGEVTGISFATGNLDATVSLLAQRGVKVSDMQAEESGRLVEIEDIDGNTLFAYEQKARPRRTGLTRLDSVTIACHDTAVTGAFFQKALGMRPSKIPRTNYTVYRLRPEGTGLLPFTPTRELYRDPADYDSDMKHIGELTAIGFTTRDILGYQEKLMARGVRFQVKAEKTEWGGMRARFLDPSNNVYTLMQMRA